ncbi:hypothetical protein ACKVMT_07155 [Halobacteriales archaeon Cl-PHB]
MSADRPSVDSVSTPATDTTPTLRLSASYLGCRHCAEGSLVYDAEVGASRCRACGKMD